MTPPNTEDDKAQSLTHGEFTPISVRAETRTNTEQKALKPDSYDDLTPLGKAVAECVLGALGCHQRLDHSDIEQRFDEIHTLLRTAEQREAALREALNDVRRDFEKVNMEAVIDLVKCNPNLCEHSISYEEEGTGVSHWECSRDECRHNLVFHLKIAMQDLDRLATLGIGESDETDN